MEGLALEAGTEVLEDEGDATKGPVRKLALGGGEGLVVERSDDRVDLGVDFLGPVDGDVDQLTRADLAARDQFCLPGRIHFANRVTHVSRSLSSPTVNRSSSSPTLRTESTTPGMNEERSMLSWRIESVWPSPPKSTS